MTLIRHQDSHEAGISAVVYRVSFVVDIHSFSVGRCDSNANFASLGPGSSFPYEIRSWETVILLLANVVATQMKHEIQRIQALLISISEVFNDYL